jgi:hypothetical protein
MGSRLRQEAKVRKAIDRRVAEISVSMKIRARFVNSSAPNFTSRTCIQEG